MNTNNIDKVLGQKVESPNTYTPSILVREERQRNRTYLNLDSNNLPFVGYDIWNGYECSCLTDKGLPVTCIAKVVYPATNKYIVESKSMKLYWNGFNMQPMGKNAKEALKNLKDTAIRDLSSLLETDVKIHLFSQVPYAEIDDGVDSMTEYEDITEFTNLEELVSSKKTFTVFNETASLLKVEPAGNRRDVYLYASTLLRSNCKITKQPDSGDIYIGYRGSKTVTPESLLEWIVSLRNECHFHEEICEAAYKRLWDILQPDELVVTCYYARRGGWDINPTRASHKKLLDRNLINSKMLYSKLPKQ